MPESDDINNMKFKIKLNKNMHCHCNSRRRYRKCCENNDAIMKNKVIQKLRDQLEKDDKGIIIYV